MARQKLRYADFADRINVDALEDALGWTPEYQRGDNDVGYCPWPENHAHGDTTGKFAIERVEKLYNCYVCGGGDLLSLAMETQGLDVDDATHWLYQFCEEDLRTDNEFVTEFLSAFEDATERIASLPYFNERVLDNFREESLDDAYEWDDDKDEWVKFYDKRAIAPEVAEEYGVYWGAALKRRSPPRGKFAEDSDYVGPGIIFTHHWKDRLVGWQTRWVDPDRPEWLPKYTNTTDFPKETTIYGYDQARRSPGPVIVVESAPSALFAISHGHPAVATFGSSVNPAQMRLLRRFSQGVILVPDADKPSKDGGKPAGIKWRDSLTEYLKRYIDVWHLPPVGTKAGADLGDLALLPSPQDALDELLHNRIMAGVDL